MRSRRENREASPEDPGTDGEAWRRRLGYLGGWTLLLLLVGGMFRLAGRWDWAGGWILVSLLTLCHGMGFFYLKRRNPEVLRRRARIGPGTEGWDLWWLFLFGLLLLGIVVLGALDGGRYGWSSMSPWWRLPGTLLFLSQWYLITWAMAVNPHFEKTVRIRREGTHEVIRSGPYGFVRHPGYTAIIFGYLLTMPLLLSSWWAFVPAGLGSFWVVLRTWLEDRVLRKGLPGYSGYCREVGYRLIPGIW